MIKLFRLKDLFKLSMKIKKTRVDYDVVSKFITRCKDFSVVPMTTCFARGDIDDLINIGFKEIKIAS